MWMTDEYEYSEETVVGHHVVARLEEQSLLSKQLDEIADVFGMNRRYDSPMVEITVRDVDWEESKTVRLRLDTLVDITETLVEEYEDD
jgi:hypothetical protein